MKDVIAARREAGHRGGVQSPRAGWGRSGRMPRAVAVDAPAPSRAPEAAAALAAPAEFAPTHGFTHRFTVARPPEQVFAYFADVRAVAAAIPGVTLTAADERHAEGAFAVGLGPVAARFRGRAEIARNPETMSGRILAAGGDDASASRARGQVDYAVRAEGEGAAVELRIGYALTGLLGQVGRPGLIEAVARGLIAKFATNLERAMGGEPGPRQSWWSRWAAWLRKAWR